MNKKWIIFITTILGLYSCFLLATETNEIINLVPNSGFEEVSDNEIPSGWLWSESKKGIISAVSNIKRSGEKSLKITTDELTKTKGILRSKLFPVKPNTPYEVKCWYKIEQSSGDAEQWCSYLVWVYWFDRNQDYISRSNICAGTTAISDWTETIKIVKSPEDTFYAAVEVSSWSAIGTVYFDDIEMKEYSLPEAESDSSNLIHNSSFENVSQMDVKLQETLTKKGWILLSPRIPDGWAIDTDVPAGTYELVEEKETAFGNKYIRIKNHQNQWCNGYIYQSGIKLSPLETYELSIWIKGSPDAQCFVSLHTEGKDGSKKFSKWLVNNRRIGVNEWQKCKTEFEVDEIEPQRYILGFFAWGGEVDIDNVSLKMVKKSPFRISHLTLNRAKDFALYEQGEPVNLNFTLIGDISVEDALLKWVVEDYYGKQVKSEERKINFSEKQIISSSLSFLPDKKGSFRIILTLSDKKTNSIESKEITLGVVEPEVYNIMFSNPDYPLGHTLPTKYGGYRPEYAEFARRIGVKWIKLFDFSWHRQEPEKGVFPLEKDTKEKVKMLYQMGFNLFGALYSTPKWASSVSLEKNFNRYPPDMNMWSEWVYSTVNAYKQWIKYWEIWNEPHYEGGWQGSPEEYVELLKVAYKAAKEADPECKIIGGGGVSVNSISFIERIFKAGALNYMDIFSIHGYVEASGEMPLSEFDKKISLIRELMKKYGEIKPIWNTEHSIFGGTFYKNKENEREREAYIKLDKIWHREYPFRYYKDGVNALIHFYLSMIKNGVEKTVYYMVSSQRPEEEYYNFTTIDYQGCVRPMYMAYSNMVYLLYDKQFVKTVKIGDRGYGFIFKDNKGTVLTVIYQENCKLVPSELEIPLPPENFIAIDVMGNEVGLKKTSDVKFTVLFSEEPLYLITKKYDEKILAKIFSGIEVKTVPAEFDTHIRSIYFKDISYLEGVSFVEVMKIPGNLKVYIFKKNNIYYSFILPSAKQKILLVIDGGNRKIAVIDGYGRTMEISENEKMEVFLTEDFITLKTDYYPAEIIKTIQVKGIAFLKTHFKITEGEKGEPAFTVSLLNISNKSMTEMVNIENFPSGLNINQLSKTFLLEEDERKTLKFSLSKWVSSRGIISSSVKLPDEELFISYPVSIVCASKVKEGISIEEMINRTDELLNQDDSVIIIQDKEQVKIGEKVWKCPDDLSARAYTGWDENNLYFVVKVKDDYLYQPFGGRNLYLGDSIEIFLDFTPAENMDQSQLTEDIFHFCIAPQSLQVKTTNWSLLSTMGHYKLEPKVVSKTIIDGYILGIKLPVPLEYGLYQGKVIGFDIAVNDADISGQRKTQIIWAGEKDNYCNRGNYGTLILK